MLRRFTQCSFLGKLALGVSTLVLLSAGARTRPELRQIEIPYSSNREIGDWVKRGYDVAGVNLENKTLTLIVEEGQPIPTSKTPVASRPIPVIDSGFKTPAEVDQALHAMEDKYPGLVTLFDIGKSVEGRTILAAQVTARFVVGSQTPKPSVLFDSLHHAREVMTPEVTLDIVDQLSSLYQKDPEVTKWLDEYQVWVVPMVNPDGSNYAWNRSSSWRKNTRGGYGVDINRNYPFQWNQCGGSSGNRNDETYRGPQAASESETTAIMSLVQEIRPLFNISYHSFSEIVIYPYGCRPDRIPLPDRTTYERIGKELAAKLVRDTGSGSYQAGTSYDLLYNIDGGSTDWIYDATRTMAFTVEINSSAQGFQPSYSRWRDITVQRQRPGWRYILQQMDKPGIR